MFAWILYRQNDCVKNSKQQTAQTCIPHKELLGKNTDEQIVLLKETSVSGYVALQDLTRGGDIIRGATYQTFMPLLAVAAIYLAMVMFFTHLVNILERRLRAGER